MVSTRNTSRSLANPSRMQDQPGGVDSRPPGGALETVQANTNELEALRLTNQRLIEELEQLTRQMQRPRESQQAQEGHNTTPQEEQPHLGPPREAEAKSSRARGHGPHLAPKEEHNEAIPRGDLGNDEPTLFQHGMGEKSWEKRFKGIQQELSHMKESSKAERRTLWTPWYCKMSHRSRSRCSTFPFQQNSKCRKLKRLMAQRILSTISTLIRIK